MMDEETDIGLDVSGAVTGLTRQMRALDAVTAQFGRSLSRALASGIAQGKGFDDILRNIGQRFLEIALKAAFKPLENSLGSMFSTFLAALGASVVSGAVAPPPSSRKAVWFRPRITSPWGGGWGLRANVALSDPAAVAWSGWPAWCGDWCRRARPCAHRDEHHHAGCRELPPVRGAGQCQPRAGCRARPAFIVRRGQWPDFMRCASPSRLRSAREAGPNGARRS